jgi:nucleotide-binding universal stress UspA family protein
VEIVRRVIEHEHDLGVLTSDGSSDAAATIRRVQRTCPSLVWVLRPPIRSSRVLAAVNPDDDPALNHTIVELAQSVAEHRDSPLHVAHAWRVYGLASLLQSDRSKVSLDAVSELITEVEIRHRGALNDLLERSGFPMGPNVHLADGSPVDAISGLIELYRVDLLVMGSIGRSTTDGVFVGNIAEQVLNRTSCSILMVKPPGFVSSTPVSSTTVDSLA